MKKCLSAVVAICLVVLLAVPAMALDTKFSGQYRVRGFHNSNLGLDDNDASDSYFNMRFRLQTDFMVSDHLTVTTRFDALDNKEFGRGDKNTGDDSDNIDWDRAYMTIKTDMGTFMAGRMSGGTWGTLFNDTEGERDRLRWHNSFGNLTLYTIYEKNAEGDIGNDVSDEDFDVYYLGLAYKMENISAGLLYGFLDDKRDFTAVTGSDVSQYHLFIPFVMGQFGPFGFQGELRYNGFGEREFDNPALDDRDIDQLAYNLEGTFSMDMFQFELGYAYTSGQDAGDDDITGYSGLGDDWQKVWILTNSEDDNVYSALGGFGNLASPAAATPGAHIYYGGITIMPMEKLDVKFLVAYAEADETPSGIDDEFGWEYDLFVNYKIFDNLTYSFVAAYLDAGDFWEDAGGTDDLENNFHLFNQLSLKF
jgi:hypothetical protein